MKLLITGAALAAAALAMSACTTANTAAVAPVANALAQNLQYCHVSGSLNAGAGGLAGTGTGLAQTLQFDCPAAARPASVPATAAATTPAAQ